MQSADVLCYMILMITVMASCIGAEEQKNELEESQSEKKISKRQATVIVENYPMDRIFQKPKVIYSRISKQRFGPPKPKFRPSKATRKPSKKAHKSKSNTLYPKYGPPEKLNIKQAHKKKPKYGPHKSRLGRPGFGHVIKMPHYSSFVPNKQGFGEPPMQHLNGYPLNQSYGEPPVDSYGAPLKTSIKDIYATPHSFQETSENYEAHDIHKQEYQLYELNKFKQNPDSNYAFTKRQPLYAEQNKPVYVTPTPSDYNEEEPLNPDESRKHILQDNKFFLRKKKPFYFADSKVVNRPWMPNKRKEQRDDDIIVGGQYAEPPGRYVPKLPPHTPMYADDIDEDTLNPVHGYIDTDVVASAKKSPYSNYKNSNMAFSPQNLNDAFSIVDRK